MTKGVCVGGTGGRSGFLKGKSKHRSVVRDEAGDVAQAAIEAGAENLGLFVTEGQPFSAKST